MCESKTRMMTNKLINTIKYEAYLSHKLSVIIRDKVNAQTQSNLMHVRGRGKPIKYSNQSIHEKTTYVGSHQNPVYFAWTNSNNSIIQNYRIKFMLILKRFKNKKNVEKTWSERKMAIYFIEKWDFGNLKNAQKMKKNVELWLFKKTKIQNKGI